MPDDVRLGIGDCITRISGLGGLTKIQGAGEEINESSFKPLVNKFRTFCCACSTDLVHTLKSLRSFFEITSAKP